MSPDGKMIAGVAYRWVLDAEGNQEHTNIAVLQDVASGERRELTLPEEMSVTSMAWSPKGGIVVAALSGAKGVALWRWDAQGNSLGELLSIANPDDVIYSLHNLAYSPSGDRIALSRKSWDWWGEERYKADLLVVAAAGGDPQVVVESEWGVAASHPSWAEDGQVLYYQVSVAKAGDGCANTEGDLWRVRLPAEGVEAPAPEPWRADGRRSLPAVRPRPTATPAETEEPEVVTP